MEYEIDRAIQAALSNIIISKMLFIKSTIRIIMCRDRESVIYLKRLHKRTVPVAANV